MLWSRIGLVIKNNFTTLNFHMHIFNISVTYMQSIKRIHWRLSDELISQSLHYQPLFNMCSGRELAKFKCCKFIKYYFLTIKHSHAHLQYVCNIHATYQNNTPKPLEGVDFKKYELSAITLYVQWSRIG